MKKQAKRVPGDHRASSARAGHDARGVVGVVVGGDLDHLAYREWPYIADLFGVVAASEGARYPLARHGRRQRKVLVQGCRAVSRAGHGVKHPTSTGIFEWLGADLVTKSMEPTLIEASADTGKHVLSAHDGQEFIYVTDGSLIFMMRDYAPLMLEKRRQRVFRCSHAARMLWRQDAGALSVDRGKAVSLRGCGVERIRRTHAEKLAIVERELAEVPETPCSGGVLNGLRLSRGTGIS